jgi:hypothetical protein
MCPTVSVPSGCVDEETDQHCGLMPFESTHLVVDGAVTVKQEYSYHDGPQWHGNDGVEEDCASGGGTSHEREERVNGSW